MKITAICKNCATVNNLEVESININKSNEEGTIITTNCCCKKCGQGEYILITSEDIAAVKALKLNEEVKEDHPIFGSDTPDSIREDINRICDEIKIDPGKIKGSIVNIGTKVLAGIASIPDEDINTVVTSYKNLTKQYAEVVIAFMPLINKAYEVVEEIKKDLK